MQTVKTSYKCGAGKFGGEKDVLVCWEL